MINKNLQKYIENNIFPKYELNDKGHGMEHINYVIRRSINFAKKLDEIDLNMVYTIASYHDIAHSINPSKHEQLSADILLADKELNKYFTKDKLYIMYEAIIDHRASLEYEPRNIYGKIISSADRNTKIEDILKRTYQYRINNYKLENLEEIIEESYNHIKEKFTSNGYASKKMYFKDKEYEKFIKDVDNLINDKNYFINLYKEVNDIK